MSLVVGVDADGVLTNLSDHNIRVGETSFKRKPVNYDGYSLEEIFDVSDIPKIILYPKAFKIYRNYCLNEPPRENVVSVFKKLNNDGFEFHSITARKFATVKGLGIWARKMLKEWNNKHGINFNSYNFCDENNSHYDKLLACKKLNVDVMIEDKPEIANYLAENGVKVLLVDAPYNKEVENDNIIRVYNWDEIYSLLKEMKETKKIEGFEKKSVEEIKEMSPDEKTKYFNEYKTALKNLSFNSEYFKKCDKKFKLIYNSLILPAKICFRIKVFGKENLPYQDGIIIASNHNDSTDQYKLGIAIGNRPFVGYAAKEIENTFRGRIFKSTGLGIFIDRNDSKQKQEASELMANYVAHGKNALIFPEGTRKNKTIEGQNKFLNRFKIGTVALAQKTGTAILPVGINTFDNRTIVRFGELIYIEPTSDLVKENENLEKTIADLCLQNCEYYYTKVNKLEKLEKEREKYNNFINEINSKEKIR